MTHYLWQTGEPDPDDEFYGVVRTDRGGPFIARWGDCAASETVTWRDGEDADDAVEGVLVWAMLPDLADFIDGEPPLGELAIIAYAINNQERATVAHGLDGLLQDLAEYAPDDEDESGVTVFGWHPLPSETP